MNVMIDGEILRLECQSIEILPCGSGRDCMKNAFLTIRSARSVGCERDSFCCGVHFHHYFGYFY